MAIPRSQEKYASYKKLRERTGLTDEEITTLENHLWYREFGDYPTKLTALAKRAQRELWAEDSDWTALMAFFATLLIPDRAIRDERYRLVVFEPLDGIRKKLQARLAERHKKQDEHQKNLK